MCKTGQNMVCLGINLSGGSEDRAWEVARGSPAQGRSRSRFGTPSSGQGRAAQEFRMVGVTWKICHFEMIIQAALWRMGSRVRLEAREPVRRLLQWLWERRWWWPGHHTQNGQ